MFKEGPSYKDSPAKAGGEGWLVNDQQQKVVRFRNDMATAHAEWVTLATYSWKPPSPPVPMTHGAGRPPQTIPRRAISAVALFSVLTLRGLMVSRPCNT